MALSLEDLSKFVNYRIFWRTLIHKGCHGLEVTCLHKKGLDPHMQNASLQVDHSFPREPSAMWNIESL